MITTSLRMLIAWQSTKTVLNLYNRRKQIDNKKIQLEDFSGGPVARNPPANAGVHGFDPGSRKILNALEQLGLRVIATEACMP